MKNVRVVIGAVSGFALFYQLAPFIGAPAWLIVAMYGLSCLLVPYLAYVIMRYGIPAEATFDEKFYEDRGERRARDEPARAAAE